MNLTEALEYGNKVCTALESYAFPTEIVGSIRRKRPVINDVDIIAIARSDEAWRKIPNALFKALQASIIKRGNELITVTIPRHDSDLTQTWFNSTEPLNRVQVDIYRARPETWGILELVRTGSKEHNVKLCAHALKNHMMLSAAKGVIKDGTVIASASETGIFKALGLEYVQPEDREEERQ